MNYLSGALRYVAGADDEPQNLVPRLVDRIKTSALPHDRRNAIVRLTVAAKESPKHQAHVGELSLKILLAILDQDADYDDTVLSTLELLISICGTLDPPVSAQSDQFLRETRGIASTNIDVFLGLPNALPLVLQTLDKHDFHIKFNAIELLAAMAANSRQTLQAAFLETPQGVSRICDLLEDSHRQIRSNSVLLLSSLCDDSSEICKIAVFSGALGKLFALTDALLSTQPPHLLSDSNSIHNHDDDDDDGSSVEEAILMQDVLSAVSVLISGTPSSQSFFRDAGCVHRLVSLLQRLVYDASLTKPSLNVDHSTLPANIRVASETQTRKNLCTALSCVTGLVSASGEDSSLVRNDFANDAVLRILVSVAFTSLADELYTDRPPDISLQLRISGFKVLSCLIREHDGFRSLFNSSTFTVTPNSVAVSPQVTLLSIMMSEVSTAARLAAFSILRDSFLADSRQGVPHMALIGAMTNPSVSSNHSLEGKKNISHGSLPSAPGLSDASDTLSYICETLKCAIVGWPNDAAPIDVFYASRLFSWILFRGESARERLLGSYVHGAPLLSQTIRSLGKCERDSGPPEVSVSLFAVMCVWLHRSPNAVSAFLSSAMNLPMVVDIIKRNSTDSSESYVLIRGLAALSLGICLWVADTSTVENSEGGFVSNEGVTSKVIPREIIEDVIRSRVGVTEFTACLDEFRATNIFSADVNEEIIWNFVEQRALLEELEGYGSLNGVVGHRFWFDQAIISVVNDVYSYICTRAIDLLDGPSVSNFGQRRDAPFTNGHRTTEFQSAGSEHQVIADSARDEVLQSYKEFIRSQDESLNAARLEIEELSTALHKAQSELDSKTHVSSDPRDSEAFLSLRGECDELRSQKEDLETLLQEKTSDFEAVSNALALLEDEQVTSSGKSVEGSNDIGDQLHNLRTDNEALRQSLELEVQKNMDLSHTVASLKDALHRKDAEVNAMAKERDSMEGSIQPGVSEALSWRSRAEVAEASLQSRNISFQSLQEKYYAMHEQLSALEHSRDEAMAKVHTMKDSLDEKGEELEQIKHGRDHGRDRGLVSSLDVDGQVEEMRAKLGEALKRLKEREREIELRASESSEASHDRDQEHDSTTKTLTLLKSELAEARRSLSQWQQRAESLEAQRMVKDQEISKLQSLTHQLEERASLEMQNTASHKNRATELEQQCMELDELRQKVEDEVAGLKKELDLRTEQSIRLSGQVYEMEESKSRLDEELQSLRLQVDAASKNFESESLSEVAGVTNDTPGASESEVKRDLEEKLDAVMLELETTRKALTDSINKENLGRALIEENEGAVARAASLEEDLGKSKAENERLTLESTNLKESLLSLEEAEESKRVLTMQVYELQKLMDENQISEAESGDLESSGSARRNHTTNEELQRLLKDREFRIQEIEDSLTKLQNSEAAWTKEKEDFENQISENRTLLDMLRSEGDQMRDQISELSGKLDTATERSNDTTKLNALEEEIKVYREKCDDFKRQNENLSEAMNIKETEIRILKESCEAEIAELQERLDKAEEDGRKLTGQLKSSLFDHQQVEREVHSLHKTKQDLVEALATAQTRLGIVQTQLTDDITKAKIETVVSAIIASTAIETTLLSSGKILERSVLATNAWEEISSALSAERHAMEGVRAERDEALSTCATFSARIEELEKDLEFQKKSASDKVATTVLPAEGSVLSLSTEADILVGSSKADNSPDLNDFEHSHRLDGESTKSPFSGDVKMRKRIEELEDALRDAARTVSSTNTELLAAQALLVELSSDKTTMRSTLSNAEQRILELEQKISTNRSQEIDGVPDQVGSLSEVSDVEVSETELPSSQSDEAYRVALLEEEVRTARLEGKNLRLVFERSVLQADVADSLLSSILSKMDEVETRYGFCHAEMAKSKESEQTLLAEVEQLKSALLRSQKELDDALSLFRKEKLNLMKSHTAEMGKLTKSHSIEIDSVKLTSEERERTLELVKHDLEELRGRLRQTNINWASEKAEITAQHSEKLHQQETELARLRAELSQANANWESEKAEIITQRNDVLRQQEGELSVLREQFSRANIDWESEKADIIAQHSSKLHQQEEELSVLREQFSRANIDWESEKAEIIAQHSRELRQQETEMTQREVLWISEKDGLLKAYDTCQKENNIAVERLREERNVWENERIELLQKYESELKQLSLNAAATTNALEKQIENWAAQYSTLKAEKERVIEDLEDTSSKLDATVERCEKLGMLRNELMSRTTDLESTVKSLIEENSSYEARILSMNGEVDEMRVSLSKQKQEHERTMHGEMEKWKAESRGYEEEIERSSQALEKLERQLRDLEAVSNMELDQARNENKLIREKWQMEAIALQECKQKLDESCVREADIRGELEKETVSYVKDRERLNLELKSSRDEVNRLTALRIELYKELRAAEGNISALKQKQTEELERRVVLEDENQEFARNVEILEQRCKRMDSGLKERMVFCRQLESQMAELASQLEAEKGCTRALEGQAKDNEERLRSISNAYHGLQEELDVTQRKLRETEEQCASWSRDNEDLREWVGELQRKAIELETVANEFEEVEQSLRETINAQQQSEDQIERLENDLRAVREELRQKETVVRKAEREKAAMEEVMKSQEHKTSELEQRLANIRETSVAKLSASEAGVRAQARRCAELETALAQAERQVAEFGKSADEAFAAKAEVRQLKDEATRLRDRCRDAEALNEQLETELQKVKVETEALRKDSGEGQMRALEAEHNELLVYLADLELELTSLREGTEQGS